MAKWVWWGGVRPGGVLTPVVMVWGYFIPVYGSGTVGFACGGGSEGLEGDMGDKGGLGALWW